MSDKIVITEAQLAEMARAHYEVTRRALIRILGEAAVPTWDMGAHEERQIALDAMKAALAKISIQVVREGS